MLKIIKVRYALGLILASGLIFNADSFAQEKQFDKYGGWTGMHGKTTGVFHTENLNGRWWVITPEGNVFFSIGMYCVRMGGISEKDSDKRPYQENCLTKYGSEQEWARVTRMRLSDWRFNTISDWSSESIFREPGFAYVKGIDLSKKAENIIPKGAYGYFPDVFSPEFKASVNETMEDVFKNQPYLTDDPQLLGYFVADEPSWYGSKGRRGSLSDDFIALDSSKPGKQAWVEFIKSRYQTIGDLNNAWSTNYKSFDDLLSINKIKDEQNVEKDKLGFLEVIAEEFSKVLAQSLRQYDKNHMILGSRPSRLYPEVVEGIGKYCDIFATSAYDLNKGYSIDPKFDETINEIYQYAKKPIMLGVLITGQDAGLPYGMVKTQHDRGISYWRYMAKIASNPTIVGVHWFQYFDPPVHCYDAEAANWGLVNEKDEPYTDAVQFIAQANKMAYAYALGLSDFAPEFDGLFGLRKEKTPETIQGPLNKIPIQIANPGFEQGGKDWSLQTWKGESRASIDYFQKHSGLASLKIQGGPDEGWGSVGVAVQYHPNFTLQPQHQYRLAAWIKTKDVENSAFVRIKVKYKSGTDDYFATDNVYGTGDWKQVEVKFTPKEENSVEYLSAQLVGKGTAWFDDISLELVQ